MTGHTRKLLVVDDEENTREALSAFFEARGYEVRGAADGPEGIRTGLGFVPDCVLCDWKLDGGLDGVDVARCLHRVHPNMHIVFMTSYDVGELRAKTLALPIEEFVQKPVSLKRLAEIVERVACQPGPRA